VFFPINGLIKKTTIAKFRREITIYFPPDFPIPLQ
jgi:hypothetical protein